MKETKFTKGKWVVRNSPAVGVFVAAPECVIENPNGPDYCVEILGEDGYGEEYEDQRLPDAHLIAAAPIMYEEIESNIRIFKSVLKNEKELSPLARSAIEAKIEESENLLKSARGEENE